MDDLLTLPSLDLAKLVAVCTDGGVLDQALLVQLLGMFLIDNAGRLERLPATVQAGDIEEARRLAHAVAGSAATAGALKLAGLARAVERIAIEGAAPPVAMVERLADEFGQVRATLRSLYPEVDHHT